MKTLTVGRVSGRCFWAAVLICTVYQSYRYPLQLNSSGTSPTYSDTPMIFQASKFLITLLISMVSAGFLFRRALSYRAGVLVVMIVCMSAYPAIKGFQAGSLDPVYANAAFWPIAATVLVLAAPSVQTSSINRYFRFVFFYALASTVVEVGLFMTIGRLPALAYAGSLSVRFGGFLDDPNAFAALLFMLMGWAFYYYAGVKQSLALGSLALCVLFTQSLTAVLFLIALTLFAVLRYLARRPRPIVVLCGSTIGCGVAILAWRRFGGIVSEMVLERSGSVQTHVAQVTGTRERTWLDWLFGGAGYSLYESWWVGSLVNFGLPWLMLTLTVTGVFCFSAVRNAGQSQRRESQAVSTGIAMLAFYFLVGCANLPLFLIFPVNFLFFVFTGMVFFGRIAPCSPLLAMVAVPSDRSSRSAATVEAFHKSPVESLGN